MTTVLLTGFEPFGGEAANPSWDAVQLAAGWWTGDADIVPVRLPVVFDAVDGVLAAAIAECDPDLTICVGLAAGSPALRVERVAANIDDARIPDNAGRQPVDRPIRVGGPAAYFATVPVKAMVRDLRAQGIVAQVSNSAGTYVCNHAFYLALDLLDSRTAVDGRSRRGGFVHVPAAPAQAGRCSSASPTLPIEVTARGLLVAIETALRVEIDPQLPFGAED